MAIPDYIAAVNATEPYASKDSATKLDWLDKAAKHRGYQETIEGVANSQTKKEFVNQELHNDLKQWVKLGREQAERESISIAEMGDE